MSHTIDAADIIELHKNRTELWHQQDIKITSSGFLRFVEENHQFNFMLWHEEDKARRDDMGFEYVYNAKRIVDRCNQQRNDRMEQMDTWVWENYKPLQDDCQVNSETPGMMIDRLSILALKEFHMREQVEREDASYDHRLQCEHKLNVIHMQLSQLKQCLAELLTDITNHARTFRVYYQFKMYNDPNLNPQLYKNTTDV